MSTKTARKGLLVGLNRLKRLPGDFSWQVLSRLFGSLRDLLPAEFSSEFELVLRKRDPQAYKLLGDRWGIQCMSPPREVLQPYKVAAISLLVSFAKKDPSLETVSPAQRRANCIQGVIDLDGGLWDLKVPVDSVLSLARQYCLDLLGDAPELDEIAKGAKHGPGVALPLTRQHTSSYFKFSRWPYHVQPRAKGLLRAVITEDKRWLGALEDSYRRFHQIPKWVLLNWEVFWDNILVDQPYNRIATVPKDGARDRPIAIEPVGGVYLQLGLERCIRDRLRKRGLDLDDQEPNRRLARDGSFRDGSLAPVTIDLSDASDTVSRDLVKRLLPDDWFQLLDSVRSPYGLLPDGSYLRYAKMSSMGNGTTFVLESLVFYCLLVALARRFGEESDLKTVRVYGDDIVIPKHLGRVCLTYLKAWGFRPNPRKSFLAGPVRESCGGDYYYGYDVRPVYFRGQVRDVSDILTIRNLLNRWFWLRLGYRIPGELDSYFMSFCPPGLPIGPESDVEFGTYIHNEGCYEPYPTPALTRRTRVLPAREFWFRRLMNNLLHVEGTFGSFDVTTRERGALRQTWRRVWRVPYGSSALYYRSHLNLERWS